MDAHEFMTYGNTRTYENQAYTLKILSVLGDSVVGVVVVVVRSSFLMLPLCIVCFGPGFGI